MAAHFNIKARMSPSLGSEFPTVPLGSTLLGRENKPPNPLLKNPQFKAAGGFSVCHWT